MRHKRTPLTPRASARGRRTDEEKAKESVREERRGTPSVCWIRIRYSMQTSSVQFKERPRGEEGRAGYKGSLQLGGRKPETSKTRDKGILKQAHICVMGGTTLLEEYKG